MSDPIYFAPLRVPFVDPQTGIITRPWQLLLQGMFNRTGGTNGPSNDDLEQLAIENLDIGDIDGIITAQLLADVQAAALDDMLVDPPSTDATDALMLLLDRDDISTGGANPSAKVGPTVVNGSASTYMRSDAAPAIDLTVTYSWAADHTFGGSTTTAVTIGGVAAAGTLSPTVSNTSTVATQDARWVINAGSNSLAVGMTNQNRATAIVTGGPTVPQAFFRTLGAQPVVFGVGNTYAGQFESATSFRLPGAIGINGNASFAQPTGYGTPTGGAHQASFAAGSITLPNLAAAVAQLIIELKSYGLLGT